MVVKKKMILFGIMAILAITCLFAFGIYNAIQDFGRVEKHLVYSASSPNNEYIADVYEIAGNATVGFYTSVHIRKNIKGAPEENDKRVMVLKGKKEVKLQWKTVNNLYISVNPAPQREDIGRKDPKVYDINISYSFAGERLSTEELKKKYPLAFRESTSAR